LSSRFSDIVEYYTDAGPDYRFWGRQLNMHFGYYRAGMNPLDLEGMLIQMNREVIARLSLDPSRSQRILDMGCGVGTTARWAAAAFPQLEITGITIVPWQARHALALTPHNGSPRRITFVQGDYNANPFRDESFDGVFALESSCYAPGAAKAPLLTEMYRLLKPGKRFAIADAFLKTNRPMNRLTRACYRALCEAWALEALGNLHETLQMLASLGFHDVKVENISKNVTPSVLHMPITLLRFAAHELLHRRQTANSKKQWRNLIADVMLIGFTIDRTRSGYFMISGTK
jgi:ubiquinone/menaquinone biosynthesis C-methylase UbiE